MATLILALIVRRLQRLAEIVLTQRNVGVEREAGRVVAEPALHLHDIATLREQS
jgi:hypothetical protein